MTLTRLLTVGLVFGAGVLAVIAMSDSSNQHFRAKATTSATVAAVWQVWTDVPNWPEWDTGLKEASLDGELALGATGTLLPQSGPRSTFTVSEWDPQSSYAFTTDLPLAQLTVRRTILRADEGAVMFEHEVFFSGFLGSVFGWVLGRDFRDQLPKVVQAVAARAEKMEQTK